jgi:hypothetical protein
VRGGERGALVVFKRLRDAVPLPAAGGRRGPDAPPLR